MRTGKIKPSRWYYILSEAILVAGAVLYCVFFFILFFSIKENILQVVVPGAHRFRLHHAGRYVVYHEYRSIVAGETLSTDRDVIANLSLSIQDPNRAKEIPVSPTPPDASYQFGSKRKAVSIFEFRIPNPGTYILSAKYTDGAGKPRVVLGVARKLSERVLLPSIALTVYTVAIIGTSGGIFWITFIKRRKAKRQMMREATQ
jgi:hypothetical protein